MGGIIDTGLLLHMMISFTLDAHRYTSSVYELSVNYMGVVGISLYYVVNAVIYCFRSRLEELKIFLETEAWELCPVRSTFSFHQLRVH